MQPKKPYEAPEIVRVRLARDELAVATCKNPSIAGPSGGGCRGVAPGGVCQVRGS
jgi:hypothetical protein